MKRINLSALAVIALLAAPRAHADFPLLSIEQIDGINYSMHMNAAGVVAGSRLEGGQYHAAVWTRETGAQALPLLPGFQTAIVNDINDAGVIVGGCQPSIYNLGKACVWRPLPGGGYSVEELPLAPGTTLATATAINNRGDIVGTSTTPFFPPQGGPVWFNSPSGLVQLWDFGFTNTPADINNNRQVVGGPYRFNLDTHLLENLGAPPGYLYSALVAINESGQAAGRAGLSSSQGLLSCVRYSDGEGWRVLDFFPTSTNSCYAINDLGDCYMITTNGLAKQPAVWIEGSGLSFLSSLIDPLDQYWYTQQFAAGGINNNQQVLAVASNDATEFYGPVELTPLGRPIIPGDINLDAHVTRDDLCFWAENPTDLTGDGTVDATDQDWLLGRLAEFGFVFDDCNRNGTFDYCDITAGTSGDCDNNLIADECQSDCNGDGVPDACEPDCNGNGIPDPCDIALFTSEDCNGNGVPDECDAPATATYTASFSPPVVIPLGGSESRTMLITEIGAIADVNAHLDLDFRVGDLAVTLEHAGTTVTLLDRPGYPRNPSGFTELGYTITLDDEGAGGPIENKGHSCCFFDPILSPPSYVPNTLLSTFDGMEMSGEWTVTLTTINNASPVAQWFSFGLTISDTGAPISLCDCNGNGIDDAQDIATGTSLDANGNGTPDECEHAPKAGDLDRDGDVDLSDLGTVLAAYGLCIGDVGYRTLADLDHNGCIDLSDLGVVLGTFGI